MALYTVLNLTKAGLPPAYTAVQASDTFANPSDERTFLHVRNGGGAAITATIPTQRPNVRVQGAGSLVIPPIVVSIPAGGERMIGPFPDAYTDGAGLVTVNYSAIATVTAAAIRMPADSL